MGGTDGELIRRFRDDRDEAAFEELVRRHGGMVLGVCRRVLQRGEGPEDAFQAAFLVLATEAAKLRKSASVASWLHGVALRVSLKAKGRAAARREHERRAAEMLKEDEGREWRETRAVIDEEVRRLPEKLRAPLVLCYLEDMTAEQAARALGWTDGEVKGRLAKARDVLHSRLARRGVAVGAAALAVLISENASAAVPPAYVASTVSAASALAGGALAATGEGASLAREVLRAMAVAKAKLVTALAGAGAAVALGAALVVTGLAASVGAPAAVTSVPDVQPKLARAPAPPAVAEPAGEEGALVDDTPVVDADDVAAVAADWDVPGPVARALVRLGRSRPDAEVERVKRGTSEGRETYDAKLDVDGRECRARIAADGEVLKLRQELAPADLPAAVIAAVTARYPDATITDAELKAEGGEVKYELELDVGGEEIDLKIAPDGEILEGEDGDEQDERDEQDEEDVRDGDADAGEEGAPGGVPGVDAF